MSRAELVEQSDYREVQNEIARALREHRKDCPPHEVARVLLSFDGTGQRLVGLRYDGQRVVFYQESSRDAIAAQFGAEGIDPRGGRPIANLSRRVSPELWIEKMRYYWSWTHPRYR